MDKNNILDGVDLSDSYVLIFQDMDNVLESLDFANDEERLLCRNIIKNLEITAAKNFAKDLCVDIPYIGKLQKNLLHKAIVQSFKELKVARETLTREEYKEFKQELVHKKRNEIKTADLIKSIKKRTSNKHYKLWIKLYKSKGEVYANAYIAMFKKLQVVKYNEELNSVYYELYS